MSTSSTAATNATETLATALPAEGTGDLPCVAAVRLRKRMIVTDAFGVTNSVYASGDVVDTKITLGAIAIGNNATGAIINAKLVLAQSMPATVPSFVLHIFHDDPSGSTFTDNGALAVVEADARDKYAGAIQLSNSVTVKSDVHVFDSGQIALEFLCGAAHDDLWAVLEIKTATTFTTDEMHLILTVEQDR
jgi:hypothetical protein